MRVYKLISKDTFPDKQCSNDDVEEQNVWQYSKVPLLFFGRKSWRMRLLRSRFSFIPIGKPAVFMTIKKINYKANYQPNNKT